MASGYNVIDFMDLQPVERSIIRLVLRKTPITYPQLREAVTTMPAEQRIDQVKLDSTLDHLTLSHWLIRQVEDQQTYYRVSRMQRIRRQNQDFWDHLGLENCDQKNTFRVNLETADMAMKRGGKRLLPTRIWDCLDDRPTEDRADEPPARKPVRRSGLFDKLLDDSSSSKNQ